MQRKELENKPRRASAAYGQMRLKTDFYYRWCERMSRRRLKWMNTEIFEEWFHESFVPSVEKHLEDIGQEPKAVLLLDNCTAHGCYFVTNRY
jgi:hypothetical protein